MLCPICKSKSIFLKNIEGYLSGSYYDIYKCHVCDCHHMNMEDISNADYEQIYGSGNNIIGYDRYRSYYNNVNKQGNPLKWLSKKESTYLPIYSFFKNNQKKLNVLEIGCGLGYLTYSIQKLGHNCVGVDISKEAIKNAQKKFVGPSYIYGNIFKEELKIENQKFDVIIATELIEHIDNFDLFFSSCNDYLKEGGTIILTTPNRGYYRKDALWVGDLPPVHTVWFHHNTFQKIRERYNYNLKTYNYSLKSSLNLLAGRIYNNHILKLKLSAPHQSSYKESIAVKRSVYVVIMSYILNAPIVRHLSNLMCYILFGKSGNNFTLGVYLTKK